MTEPAKKAPAKKARAKAQPKKDGTSVPPSDTDKFAGYTRDANGNLSDPWTAEFQKAIAEGRRWEGPPNKEESK